MLKKEQSDLLTQTGPGTPMGEMFRAYWMPALLSEELPEPDCPPVRIKLLSERLLAFRDSEGKLGLIDEFYFEHHVNTQPMNRYWATQGAPQTLADSYRIFTALRGRGVIAHAWV